MLNINDLNELDEITLMTPGEQAYDELLYHEDSDGFYAEEVHDFLSTCPGDCELIRMAQKWTNWTPGDEYS